jgi:alanine transaminase
MKNAGKGAARAGRILTGDSINKNVVEAKYAVRGEILDIKAQIASEMKAGKKFPFKDFCELNIGNPQTFKMKPITYFRQVLAVCTSPDLLDSNVFSDDVKKRAKEYLDAFSSIGCYSDSTGNPMVPRSIADFISRRDGVKANPDNIFIYNGASEAIASVMQTINRPGEKTGFMIPIPQYPLYSAQVSLNGAQFVGYYLDEENGWGLDEVALNKSYEDAVKQGIDVRAVIVINPGNPTGAIFSKKSVETLLKFAHSKGVVVLADEVYQENIYTDKKQFVSFRKVLSEMPKDIAEAVELFSFHSCSKGFLGECGVRGGYLEMVNIDPAVRAQILKLKTISLCSNTVGQIMMDLKVRPPTVADSSAKTVEQYNSEVAALMKELKEKARIMYETLNSMKGMHSNPIEGAMYAFPRVDLPKKFVAEAESQGKAPDALYCAMALKETGAVMVPGSGFKQRPGTHHFRTTILPSPIGFLNSKLTELKTFNDNFMKKYS